MNIHTQKTNTLSIEVSTLPRKKDIPSQHESFAILYFLKPVLSHTYNMITACLHTPLKPSPKRGLQKPNKLWNQHLRALSALPGLHAFSFHNIFFQKSTNLELWFHGGLSLTEFIAIVASKLSQFPDLKCESILHTGILAVNTVSRAFLPEFISATFFTMSRNSTGKCLVLYKRNLLVQSSLSWSNF